MTTTHASAAPDVAALFDVLDELAGAWREKRPSLPRSVRRVPNRSSRGSRLATRVSRRRPLRPRAPCHGRSTSPTRPPTRRIRIRIPVPTVSPSGTSRGRARAAPSSARRDDAPTLTGGAAPHPGAARAFRHPDLGALHQAAPARTPASGAQGDPVDGGGADSPLVPPLKRVTWRHC
jgi:hypothetical protein